MFYRSLIAAVAGLCFGHSVALAGATAGQAAPDFAATDSNGKAVKLSDFKGKTVVLEWTNHDCPYVRKHYGSGNMQALQADATSQGVVWLSVISSAKGQQGYVEGLEANKLSDDRKAKPSAVLLDPKGEIGRSYGATATPHMFVVGPDGKLVYGGAIDDRASASISDIPKARSYIKQAIIAATSGQPMVPATTRAYGCSVKYSGS
jgi:peroxiredoxin